MKVDSLVLAIALADMLGGASFPNDVVTEEEKTEAFKLFSEMCLCTDISSFMDKASDIQALHDRSLERGPKTHKFYHKLLDMAHTLCRLKFTDEEVKAELDRLEAKL